MSDASPSNPKSFGTPLDEFVGGDPALRAKANKVVRRVNEIGKALASGVTPSGKGGGGGGGPEMGTAKMCTVDHQGRPALGEFYVSSLELLT